MKIVCTPVRPNVEQMQTHRLLSQPGRVHQDHRPVKETVLTVERRAEWPRRVEMNVVAYDDTPRSRGGSPLAGATVTQQDGPSLSILRVHPLYIGCEITYLIKGIPYRHVEHKWAITSRDADADMGKVLLGIGQRNEILRGDNLAVVLHRARNLRSRAL